MHNFFKQQPDEILVTIFQKLSFLERIKIAPVDKRFNRIIKNNSQLALSKEEKLALPEKICDAVYLHRIEEVKELLAMGADPNQIAKSWLFSCRSIHGLDWRVSKSALLHAAASVNDSEIANILLKKGANINYQNTYGLTALHYAAREGRAEIAKFLIDQGANSKLKGFNRFPFGDAQTPSELAKEAGFDLLAQAIDSNCGWESVLPEKKFNNRPKI